LIGLNRKNNRTNKDGWLTTYADMITLILVFFILLYSMSTIDREKYELLVRAFTDDPETIENLMLEENEIEEGELDNIVGGKESLEVSDIKSLDDLYLYLSKYVDKNDLKDSVHVHKGEEIVYVRFASNLFFEADLAVLKAGARDILDQVGEALGVVEPFVEFIRVDGHTAEAAAGTSTVNDRDLSTERANEVLKYLEAYYIQDPAKLYAVGFGMYRPVAPNDSEQNRAKNRRVELLIGKGDEIQEELNKIYEGSADRGSEND
jgi:chemotaxis protein MotB